MYICGTESIAMKRVFAIILLFALAAPLALRAQESAIKGVPNDVYYLLPEFGNGYVYLRGQIPAQGKMNICAVDQTLRYFDDNGTELEAADADNILRVRIDTVWFLRSRGAFYRMYPLSADTGVALKREVKILTDVKQGAYGTTSRSSSIQEYRTLYAGGSLHQLNENKVYPHEISENLFLYKGETVYPLSKKNLTRLFPEKKEVTEAYFKAGNTLPKTAGEVQALLASWGL